MDISDIYICVCVFSNYMINIKIYVIYIEKI